MRSSIKYDNESATTLITVFLGIVFGGFLLIISFYLGNAASNAFISSMPALPSNSPFAQSITNMKPMITMVFNIMPVTVILIFLVFLMDGFSEDPESNRWEPETTPQTLPHPPINAEPEQILYRPTQTTRSDQSPITNRIPDLSVTNIKHQQKAPEPIKTRWEDLEVISDTEI